MEARSAIRPKRHFKSIPFLLSICLCLFPFPDISQATFRLSSEISLAGHGGIPFCVDLDGDGATDILWLQSPGLFHSNVFDKPPWKGRFTDEERQHHCLTATDSSGKVLWRIGEPWKGDRPFVTHSAERSVDCADIDGDGDLEVVFVRRSEILIADARTGEVERSTEAEADNAQIVLLGRAGPAPADWTILVKNAESAYPPHEYANPAWFYDTELHLLKTADYRGAGHAPQAKDIDGDGFDEFFIGFNLIDHNLETLWTYESTSAAEWDAGEMHVDGMALGEVGGRFCVALAASDVTYLLDATSGDLVWKRKGVHPQHCQIGRFSPEREGNQVFVHNKRADLQLYDPEGGELWRMTPPQNFPLGQAAPCKRQKFHVFDPTTVLQGVGVDGTDLLIFTDGGWPYAIDGMGGRAQDFPYAQSTAQDWGEVPGRPDDYGYGYYARVADFDGDQRHEVLLNDRRFAWVYETERRTEAPSARAPRSDGRVLHADFENYVDGVVQPLNAGIRWLGHPFHGFDEGTVEITRTDAFGGSRCAHVATESATQVGRVMVQARFDAPPIEGDSITEFVFRPVQDTPSDLDNLTVWEAKSSEGNRVGVKLFANGDSESGTYRLDVIHGSQDFGQVRGDGIVRGLRQPEWIRVVQHRKRKKGTVDVWVGRPDSEAWIGTYPDLRPKGEFKSGEVGDTSRKVDSGSGYWDDIRVGKPLNEGNGLAPPEPPMRDVGKELPVQELPIRVANEKQLFVDDWVVESAEGLKRTLHPVTKHPRNPLIVADRPWEGKSVLLYGAVIHDPDMSKFRIWYLAWGKHVGQPSFICYAESDDGLTWTKPDLGLHEFQGSKDNNIVIPNVVSNTTVIYDPRDPDPSQRYKAVIRADGTCGYTSPDGFHWKNHGPIMSQCYDSTTVHWDPVGEKWIASAKIFRDGKRARGYAESNDFFNWSDTYFMATVDERDGPNDQMYAMIVFRYESVYLGLLRIYDTVTDIVDIELATSRNAKRWDREIRTPFIPTSPVKGTWDYGNNSPGTDPPIRIGDELWIYYSGRGTTHGEKPNTGAIGLGTLRVDGFVSMDAGNDPGVLTTKPLRLDGRNLYVNANAVDGEVRAEVLDEAGETIEPFSLADCRPVQEDNIRCRLDWGDGVDLDGVRQRDVRIRFHLENAEFYSFWTE